MSTSVADFVGKWWVHWVDGEKGWLQKGWRIDIGTGGPAGDSAPALTGEYNVCVGFAVIDAQEKTVELSTEDHQGQQPLYFILAGSQLQWRGFYDQQPLWIYISLSETQTLGGNSYLSIYGSTTWGDPDQVGIWGGNGTPPPPPAPASAEAG